MTKNITNEKIRNNFIIATDAIDVIPMIDRVGNIFIGLNKTRPIEYIFETELRQVMKDVASHITQLFLVSLDGSIVLPW